MADGPKHHRPRSKQRKSNVALAAPAQPAPEFVMERFGPIDAMDRAFDVEYWQRQGDAAIFRAAWELVETYWRSQGRDPNELRLQRSVEAFQRLRAVGRPQDVIDADSLAAGEHLADKAPHKPSKAPRKNRKHQAGG